MNIAELKRKKFEAESAIQETIARFMLDTGCDVSGIHITFISQSVISEKQHKVICGNVKLYCDL